MLFFPCYSVCFMEFSRVLFSFTNFLTQMHSSVSRIPLALLVMLFFFFIFLSSFLSFFLFFFIFCLFFLVYFILFYFLVSIFLHYFKVSHIKVRRNSPPYRASEKLLVSSWLFWMLTFLSFLSVGSIYSLFLFTLLYSSSCTFWIYIHWRLTYYCE